MNKQENPNHAHYTETRTGTRFPSIKLLIIKILFKNYNEVISAKRKYAGIYLFNISEISV